MTKRMTALVCALLMLCALAACGDSGQKKDHTQETAAVSDDAAAEAAFDKAFEADKSYDIDAMAEVEYSVNFSRNIDRDKAVNTAKEKLNELDESSLEQYRESLKDITYTVVEKTALTGEELKDRIAQLSQDYRDTDRITAIIKLTYDVNSPDSEEAVSQNAVEMIEVGEKWYCFMGDSTWAEE